MNSTASSRVCDLARVLGGLELRDQLAELRARGDAELGGELVAGKQRARRPVAAPVEGRGEHLAGELEMGLDRLLGGEGPAAAGREAVGDGEQGDVGGDRLGGPQVLVDPPGRQRHLVDEEAEPQVVQGQRLQVGGERAAGAQPPADRADDLRPDAVVADEGDVAAALAARRRLADVVQDGAEAQRGAAGHLVGERLVEQRPHLLDSLAGEAAEVGLDLERALEHRQRVAVDVEVVVGALLDVAQRGELGQDDRREAEVVEQGEAAQGVGAADQLAQLGQLPLARRLRGPGRFGARERRGPRVDLQPEAGGEPRGAQQAQRVRGEAALADDAQDAALEVAQAAVGVERLAARERHGDGADREVALRQIGLDRLAAQGGRVHLPGPVAIDHAPGGELRRELEGVPPARRGDRPRRRLRAAGDGEVEVGDLAAQRRVAHRAADDPGLDPGLAPERHARASSAPRESSRQEAGRLQAHPRSRGTRAEIPQVTS